MTFSEINYSDEQQSFLNYLKDIKAVLHTIILQSDVPIVDVYEASRIASIDAMRVIKRRIELEFEELKLKYDIQSCFVVQIFDEENLAGESIDLVSFVGPGYDLENQKITLYTYGTSRHAMYPKFTEGFVYAFIEPPHGISFPVRKKPKHTSWLQHDILLTTELVKSYLRVILSVEKVEDAGRLSIFSWSTDWSNYFDDGKEGWGEFCWTIYNPDANTITFIAASATD